MKSVNYEELSKEISYALRHAPHEYELEMDTEGYVSIEQLLTALNETNKYPREIVQNDLEHIINTSDKKRHEIDGDRIRALYGHSIPMHIEKVECIPPYATLYHGTAHKFVASINAEGLKPMARQYVHLGIDRDIAEQVGKRRDNKPVIYGIITEIAVAIGTKFYKGNDKIWLADFIPKEALFILEK